MTFDAAGITAYVAGSSARTTRRTRTSRTPRSSSCSSRGAISLGIVTQFNVKVADASMLDRVAEEIDELFRTAQEPTATFSEKAFIGRIADDIIELVGFARWLGLGCLAAVLALVANSIVLGVQSRVSEHAVLQTLGYSGRLIAAADHRRGRAARAGGRAPLGAPPRSPSREVRELRALRRGAPSPSSPTRGCSSRGSPSAARSACSRAGPRVAGVAARDRRVLPDGLITESERPI
jgi:hypothetical protein